MIALLVILVMFGISLWNKRVPLQQDIVIETDPISVVEAVQEAKEIQKSIKTNIKLYRQIDSLNTRRIRRQIEYQRALNTHMLVMQVDTVSVSLPVLPIQVVEQADYTQSDSLQRDMEDLLLRYQEVLVHMQQMQEDLQLQKDVVSQSPFQFGDNEQTKFLVKSILSLIFTLASLYVVLSKKYDSDTKKWALSTLSLIAGVWVGSI